MFEILMLTSLVLAVGSQFLPEEKITNQNQQPEDFAQQDRQVNPESNCYQPSSVHLAQKITKPLSIQSTRAPSLKYR